MLTDLFKTFTIVDIETTTLDGDIGEIIESAVGRYRNNDWVVETKLFGSKNSIDPASSAMTHISNRMIAGLPKFGEKIGEDLYIVAYDWALYRVAHNAQYDRAFIAKKVSALGLDVVDFLNGGDWICTLNLAKKLLEGKAEKFNLNYLRYFLELDVPDDYIAHRAGNDVYITCKLFEHLVMMMIEQGLIDLEKNIGQQIVEYTNKVEPYQVWPFGKHKGQTFSEVPDSYYAWAIENMDALKEGDAKYDARLAYSITKYFESKDR